MRLAVLFAAAAALFAGPALACPDYDDCPRMDNHAHGHRTHVARYGDHERYDDGYGRRTHVARYSEHRERHAGGWRDRPCDAGCGEITLPASFFLDSGGVGPIPDSGFVGGGGGFAFADSFAGARASAFASAHAFARANVSIRFRGGFKGHHGGHKGGKRH